MKVDVHALDNAVRVQLAFDGFVAVMQLAPNGATALARALDRAAIEANAPRPVSALVVPPPVANQ